MSDCANCKIRIQTSANCEAIEQQAATSNSGPVPKKSNPVVSVLKFIGKLYIEIAIVCAIIDAVMG